MRPLFSPPDSPLAPLLCRQRTAGRPLWPSGEPHAATPSSAPPSSFHPPALIPPASALPIGQRHGQLTARYRGAPIGQINDHTTFWPPFPLVRWPRRRPRLRRCMFLPVSITPSGSVWLRLAASGPLASLQQIRHARSAGVAAQQRCRKEKR